MPDPTVEEQLRQQVADLTAKLSEAEAQAAPARRIRELEEKLEKATAKAARPDPTSGSTPTSSAAAASGAAETPAAREPDDWDAIGA